MLNKIIPISAVMLGALLPTSASAAVTIFSENFNGTKPGGAVGAGQPVGAFTVTAGDVDVLGDLNGAYFGCPGGAGNNCIDMNGNAAGSLLGLVDLQAGKTYRVLFDLAGNGDRPSNLYQVGVSLGASGPNVFGVAAAAPFTTFSFDYVAAASGSASLAFQSLTLDSPSFWGPILDNVRVVSLSESAVPEPGTWAMMISGFGLAGAGLRRRAAAPIARLA